jgi:hypothetical protein
MVRQSSAAGVIAAAFGSLLCLGTAQAQQATSGLCYFDNTGGTLPGPTCDAYSVHLEDKLFTVVSAPSSGVGKVAWETSPPLPANPDLWQVAIDWEGSGLAGPVQGAFSYTVQILGGSGSFASIGLSTAGDYPSAGVDSTVTKEVYQGLDGNGPLIDSVTSLDGSSSYSAPIGGTQIFVRDSWDVADGATLDNVSNYIRQNDVPGPLPVLGALSALAMARRLRARLS